MYIYIYTHTHTYTYTYMHIPCVTLHDKWHATTHPCSSVGKYPHIYEHTRIHKYIHIHTYTYTYLTLREFVWSVARHNTYTPCSSVGKYPRARRAHCFTFPRKTHCTPSACMYAYYMYVYVHVFMSEASPLFDLLAKKPLNTSCLVCMYISMYVCMHTSDPLIWHLDVYMYTYVCICTHIHKRGEPIV
jgi:hypothetical protein